MGGMAGLATVCLYHCSGCCVCITHQPLCASLTGHIPLRSLVYVPPSPLPSLTHSYTHMHALACVMLPASPPQSILAHSPPPLTPLMSSCPRPMQARMLLGPEDIVGLAAGFAALAPLRVLWALKESALPGNLTLADVPAAPNVKLVSWVDYNVRGSCHCYTCALALVTHVSEAAAKPAAGSICRHHLACINTITTCHPIHPHTHKCALT